MRLLLDQTRWQHRQPLDLVCIELVATSYNKNDFASVLFTLSLAASLMLNFHMEVERTLAAVVLSAGRIGAGITFLNLVVTASEMTLAATDIPSVSAVRSIIEAIAVC